MWWEGSGGGRAGIPEREGAPSADWDGGSESQNGGPVANSTFTYLPKGRPAYLPAK